MELSTRSSVVVGGWRTRRRVARTAAPACDGPAVATAGRVSFALAALALVGAAALFLSPMLRTGYISDDLISSLGPGMMRWTGKSLARWTAGQAKDAVLAGRFNPAIWAQLCATFYTIRDVYFYKLYILSWILVDLVLFVGLVRVASKDRGLACLAGVLALPCIQFRAFHDPVLSFFGQMQVVLALALASFIGLHLRLERGGRGWLFLSAISYLIAMLIYETVYPFLVVYLAWIAAWPMPWRERARVALPYLQAAGFCLVMTAFVRWVHPTDSPIYRLNLDPAAFGRSMALQLSGALPLSYLAVDPARLFPTSGGPAGLLRWLLEGKAPIVAGLASAACLLAIRLPRADPATRPRPAAGLGLGIVAAGLAVLPAVLVCLTARYQQEIGLAKSYVPVYLQIFGVALAAAALIRSALDRLAARPWLAVVARLATIALVGLATGATYRANSATADALAASPGSPKFNDQAAGMGGAWHHQRLNLEAALRHGLMDPVPEHSRIVLANEYGDWHGPTFSLFFYAMNASKLLATMPPTPDRPRPERFAWHDSLLRQHPIRADRLYTVRDTCLGSTAGYVVLSESTGAAHGEIRLFVRSPRLYRDARTPAFLVVAEPLDRAVPSRYLKRGSELRLVSRGRDWGLFSLRPDAGELDPSSLRIVFDPSRARMLLKAADLE